MAAEWRDVPSSPMYQVSETGDVRSKDRIIQVRTNGRGTYDRQMAGQPIAFTKLPAGYLVVQLGRGHKRTVHSLVAEAFIGPRPKGMDINHKDGNKKNNNVGNLEYCSRSANMKHAYDTGLVPKPPLKRGTDQHLCRLDEDKVRAIRKWHEDGGGIAQMARHYDVGESTIRNLVQRKSWAWLD